MVKVAFYENIEGVETAIALNAVYLPSGRYRQCISNDLVSEPLDKLSTCQKETMKSFRLWYKIQMTVQQQLIHN